MLQVSARISIEERIAALIPCYPPVAGEAWERRIMPLTTYGVSEDLRDRIPVQVTAWPVRLLFIGRGVCGGAQLPLRR